MQCFCVAASASLPPARMQQGAVCDVSVLLPVPAHLLLDCRMMQQTGFTESQTKSVFSLNSGPWGPSSASVMSVLKPVQC